MNNIFGSLSPTTLPAIIGLCVPCRPPAIPRRVGTIVVDAINFHFRRAWSHIAEELGKVMKPFRTNRNPSPAIVLVRWLIRIQASGFHMDPGPVLACLVVSDGEPVRPIDCSHILKRETPTTTGVPRLQAIGENFTERSAVALAKPLATSRTRQMCDGEQSPESLLGKVCWGTRHDPLYHKNRVNP